MIKMGVRRITSGGKKGWAIVQLHLSSTGEIEDHTLITKSEDNSPKYGLFEQKKQAQAMLEMIWSGRMDQIKAWLDVEMVVFGRNPDIQVGRWATLKDPANFAFSDALRMWSRFNDPYDLQRAIMHSQKDLNNDAGYPDYWRKETSNYFDQIIIRLEELVAQ